MKNKQYIRPAQYKKGIAPIIIALIIAVIFGGGYMLVKHQESKKLEVDTGVSWKNYTDSSSFEYPPDWTVQEELSYGVDGKVNFGGLSLVPPVAKAPLPKDKIFIGAHRISICSDVPKATKCAGGGKDFPFTVTFTNSANPYVLDMFDKIVKRWGKPTNTVSTSDWKTYQNTSLGFEIKYPSQISPKWISQSNNAVLRLAGQIGDVFLEVAMSAYSLEEVQKISFSASNYKVESVFLGGEKAMKVTNSNDLSVSPSYSVYVIKNGFVYSVTIPLKSVDAEKILSTFKFTSSVATNEQKATAAARKVLEALNARDYQKLEDLVSPNGLSLGKEPNVDYINNLIAKNDVSEIPKDTKVYFWGYTDGKGDPINLSRVAFINGFIYSGTVDYLKAPDVAVNKTLGKGNSFNTMDKAAQNGYTYVAFHFSGFDEKYGGMDWTTIYLVFDSVNGEYKLRGIAKDNWTI